MGVPDAYGVADHCYWYQLVMTMDNSRYVYMCSGCAKQSHARLSSLYTHPNGTSVIGSEHHWGPALLDEFAWAMCEV